MKGWTQWEFQQRDRKYTKEQIGKNTITEVKNTLDGINIRLDDREEEISKLEDIAVETIQLEQQKKK